MKDPAVPNKKPNVSIDYLIGYVEGLMEVSGNDKMKEALRKLYGLLKELNEREKK